MNPLTAFDHELYLQEQTEAISQRVSLFDNKLYLEFGGKLLFDYHAARVLPGFRPNSKMQVLHRLKDQAELILCIYAGDIQRRKMRADFGISYDADAFKLVDDLRDWGVEVRSVVITRFAGEPGAVTFGKRLQRQGISLYYHKPIAGYPLDLDLILSDQGYGANPYIETSRPLVIVTAPGPNSGKMGTCLCQIYHEAKRGIRAGYAKFETFPVWNLPVRHPINIAYEAATADLGDVNMIDPFHLEAHGVTATNYNRDIQAFPLLRRILGRIMGGTCPYQSPTDMGVNRVGFALVNDGASRHAACQEILRRYYRCSSDVLLGQADVGALQKIEGLMEELGITGQDRPVVQPSFDAAAKAESKVRDTALEGIGVGAALQLPDGPIITGKNSPLLHAASALVLNCIKRLAGLPGDLDLLSPNVIASIALLKKDVLGRRSISLDLGETLIALSVSSTTNPAAAMAMKRLSDLRGCDAHMTHLPPAGDERAFRRLGIHLTCSPAFATNRLFVS